MKFEEAFKLMRTGKPMHRASWLNKQYYLRIDVNYRILDSNGDKPFQFDYDENIMGEDWECFNEEDRIP